MDDITGKVLRIEKCSIYDGDGLRTVVFLKGCPLRCAWCASPESQDEKQRDVARQGDGSPVLVRQDRRTVPLSHVVAEIAKDEIFYYHSGGGVTVSGGEPLAQPEFCAAILRECKKMGIHTAIETAAFGDYRAIEAMLPYLDLIYADIKLMDDSEHRKWTGVSNATILENITRISQSFDGKLRIRIPLIPTVNLNSAFLKAAAEFCKNLARLDAVEVLPYHRLGAESYRKLGRVNPMGDIMPPGEQEVQEAISAFEGVTSNSP